MASEHKKILLWPLNVLTITVVMLCFSIACDAQKPKEARVAKAKPPVLKGEEEPALSATEKARLAELELKRDQLKALVIDLKKVVESLNAETKAAEAVQKEFEKLRKGIRDKTLKSVLERAHEKQGETEAGRALRAEARGIDAALKSTMAQTTLEKDAHAALLRTQTQIDELQRSVRQIAPTTKVAFQARTMLLQSALALPELRALAKAN